ncbi:hypothetical protein GGD41_001461 [Paraburkholderia bryophila]|uniref:HTH lysR-type domain-containing protein n=1 Tax=Paraburkholderia bryophila TaxID=420952 RepID=A0A7Y9W5S3_9BURK|nr:hypothetical protein [Paraburkholderia bryophila]
MNQSDTPERGFRPGLPNRADGLSTSVAASYASIMAFMAVVSEGSFAKAGERLGVGRSAVSRNVQKLETQLSTRLFLRTTRFTQLTHEGKRFFENCNQGVTQIVEAMNDMLELRQGPAARSGPHQLDGRLRQEGGGAAAGKVYEGLS